MMATRDEEIKTKLVLTGSAIAVNSDNTIRKSSIANYKEAHSMDHKSTLKELFNNHFKTLTGSQDKQNIYWLNHLKV